jgi:hypothetical protein
VPLDVNAATFATPGSNRGAVTLVVGVGAASEQGVPLEVVAGAFDRGGRSKGMARQSVQLSGPASDTSQERRFDVLSRLDLPPGDYEIRVAVSGSDPVRTASVFTYVTVPAFGSAPLSLSSLAIGATAGTLTAPKDFLAALLPIVPTARRDFARVDNLIAFLRIYQGTARRDPPLPVQLRSSVLDAHGKDVAREVIVLDVGRFDKGRTADHFFALPLSSLVPGEYVMQIEASMGHHTAGRATRFTVK